MNRFLNSAQPPSGNQVVKAVYFCLSNALSSPVFINTSMKSVCPVFQRMPLKLREVKLPAQEHTAVEWQRWGSKLQELSSGG